MGTAADRRLAASPRRHVRWTYLRDAWPDCPDGYDAQHVLDAPEAAIVEAVARDLQHYTEILTAERTRRVAAEVRLEALRTAVAAVLAVRDPAGVPVQLALLEALS